MTKFAKIASVLMVAAVAAVWGCSGSVIETTAKVELTPAATNIQMGATYNLRITNSGDGMLKLKSLPLIGGEGCPGGGTAFSVVVPDGVEFPYEIAPWSNVGEGQNSKLDLVIQFNDADGVCSKNATLTISSNDSQEPEKVLTLLRAAIEPNIVAEPNPLDMGFVPVSPIPTEEYLLIQNTGLQDLEINKVEVIGFAEGFSFVWPCERNSSSTINEPWATDKDARIPVTVGSDAASRLIVDGNVCSGSVIVKPAESIEIPMFYTAITPNAAKAVFRFHSNDPDFDSSKGEAYEVTVQANVDGPCLKVTPDPIDFGSVVAGTGVKGVNVSLFNCSAKDNLEITNIYKNGDNCAEFAFDFTGIDSFDAAHPLVIAPNQTVSLVAKYTPADVALKDDQNQFIPDECMMAVDNNSPRQTVETPMIGVGVEAQCAKCGFVMAVDDLPIVDGTQINPQTEIAFTNTSTDPTPNGGIDKYDWTVTQPGDSVQVYVPTASARDTTFQPNIVGDYEFCLEVTNKDGCSDKCCQTVKVAPPEGLHIELTWNTPADPDQTDECGSSNDCGSDLDMHVVHPLAGQAGMRLDPETGSPYGFFDDTYDCFSWMNPHPDWDQDHLGDPHYQPNFDRDDTDGGGPENFTYTIPDPDYSTTNPNCYKVGVHYYDDHTFGKSYPTIRVFIHSTEPVYTKRLDAGMSMLDMWDVGRVCYYNTTQVFYERVNNDGTPHIIHNYTVPWFD